MKRRTEMRIAMLSPAPAKTHGWGRYTRDLVKALAACGVEINLITSVDAPQSDLPSDLPVAAYHRILPSLTPAPRLNSFRLLASIPAVRRLSAGCDVIHAIAEPYALVSPVSRQVFVTAHGTYVARTAARPIVGRLYRRVYRQATIICVSSYTQRAVQAALPGSHTVVIPNGVDVARYQHRPSGLPEKRGPTILSVGQVKPRKGFHVLAQAMRLVRAAIPGAQAVFIGDMADVAYRESIQAQLEADGLSDAVRWLGRVPDETLLGWYHTADVFALPALDAGGKFEGFGLVYLEASAAGLPVVGTRDCGAEDAIRDGETGFLVPQNDPAATADVLIRLLNDPGLRARLGTAGAAFAGEHGWDRVARRVLDLYVESCR
jgi:phosphatidylinositol alpha-1,6-mannosyltransferase